MKIQDLPAGAGCRFSIVKSTVSAAFALSFLSAAGAFGAPAMNSGNPQRAAEVDSVCRTVLGYTPIAVEYRSCVDSLAQSLANADGARLIERDRQSCATGAQPETPGECATGRK